MKVPRISVVIPTFERNVTLKKAVISVLNQTFKDFEILVINDSNKEQETISILNEFNDNRINYFRNNRSRGGNGARNTGIIKSNGDYIAFLDDDDEWLENKLQEQFDFLDKTKCDVGGVWSGFLLFENDIWQEYDNFFVSELGCFSKNILLGKVSLVAGSNIMIKKKIIEDIGLYDESMIRYQDIEFVIRLLRDYKLPYLNKIHVKIYPSGISNPFVLAQAYKAFLNKIEPELSTLTKEELKFFFTHNFYILAKLFSENGNFLKTLIYIIKIHRFRILNPITSISFLLNSVFCNFKNEK